MTPFNLPPFVHRRNSDRTVDSICAKCVATIARRLNEDDLAGPEAAHRCDPRLLEAPAALAAGVEQGPQGHR